MRKARSWKVDFVLVVLMASLAPTAFALDFPMAGDPSGTEYTVDYALPAAEFFHFINAATVNFEIGSSLPADNIIITTDNCIVNFNNCDFGLNSKLWVTGDTLLNGNVTFYGTEFAVDGTPVDPTVTELFLPNNVLTGTYGNGDTFAISVECYDFPPNQMTVNLVWLGGPSVIEVDVDIKPESAENTITLGSMGVIPVGILSTADFDATQVDPWTVELAGAGVAVRGKGSKLLSGVKDLNGDGLMDLEVKVETENLDPGQFQDGVAILTGQTYDGLEVQGSDTITIVPTE